MINLKYMCDIYNQSWNKFIKFIISMKLSQFFVKMWTNRSLGLNTNF